MRRKNKNFYIILCLVVLFGISVGYAVINRTLNITGNSEVKQNTWNIYFDNLKVSSGSVTAIEEPTINNTKLIIDFKFMLNLPGDFYEFTVDVVNSGTIDAMLDSIIKNPELTEEQKKYMNYIIEYQNGEQISSKQLVSANGGKVKLKVRVDYKTDLTEVDLPTEEQSFNLSFALNYVQADPSTAVEVKDNGVMLKLSANGDINDVGTIVTIGSEQFYTIGTEGNNVKLFAMYNIYDGYESTHQSYQSYASPTGLQDSNMKGFVSTDQIWHGTTMFSYPPNYSGTNYSDYIGSVVEIGVKAYKNLLETNFGISIVEARLITKDELTSSEIGCDEVNKTCKNAVTWAYSTSYWTGTAASTSSIWSVRTDKVFASELYLDMNRFGMRPVIVISKDYF